MAPHDSHPADALGGEDRTLSSLDPAGFDTAGFDPALAEYYGPRPAPRRWPWLMALLLLAAVGLGVWLATRPPSPPSNESERAERLASVTETATVLSEVYSVDRIYRSMQGPWSTQQIHLGEPEADELVWITGYAARMVEADGTSPQKQDFMCHSNLDIDTEIHQMLLGPSPGFNSRLFTLSQGQQTVQFPPGFGIPVRSSERLGLTTQVLNLNLDDASFDVRHQVSIDYVPDAAARESVGEPLVPLVPVAAFGLASLAPQETASDAGYFGVEEPMPEMHGPGCLVEAPASDHAYLDPQGRSFTGHWQVPPGRQVNRTLVTHLMQVPYPTTIHYVAVHLHPFAESLTLRNLTTGETLFEAKAENFTDRIGLARVDDFSSVEGVPVDPEHEYELVSVYDNTSDTLQDSMAVMYIYLRDQVMEERLSDTPVS